MSLPEYLYYTETLCEWLQSIPRSWDLLKGKRIFSQRKERADTSDEQLAASQAYGILPQKKMMEITGNKVMLALGGTESFRRVAQDDFVISLRSFEGGIEHSAYDGCVSPAYTVLTSNREIHPWFYRYLLKCGSYVSALQASTDSLRDGKSVTFEQFGDIALPYPSVGEQRIIACFLDHETAKIDTLIHEQKRLIELLQEKRQAMISHAVTKGLDPNVPMKDSGVEWLGEVPAHWKVSKLAHYASVLTGFPFPSASFSYDNSDVRLLRGTNVGVGSLKWDDTVYWAMVDDDSLKGYLMESGQIVLGMDRPWIKDGVRVAKVGKEDLPCLLLQRVAAIRSSNNLQDEYLYLLLKSELFKAYIEPDLTGVSVPHISPEQILSFQIPLPNVAEQMRVSDFVMANLNSISSLLDQSGESIDLLQERRSAIISAAVTGKLDVRDWQPPAVEGAFEEEVRQAGMEATV
jgi:type I restriction enzyme S subunit